MQTLLSNQAMIRVLGFTSFILLSSCTSIVLTPRAGDSVDKAYTSPEDAGLKVIHPFPNPSDVCVSLYPNSITKQHESENHFLIACPSHEKGAIEDRKVAEKAQIVGYARNWVVMRIPDTLAI